MLKLKINLRVNLFFCTFVSNIKTMDIECPYCGEEQSICHDDGFGYGEGILHQMKCESCGKSFVFETTIFFNYSPQRADCLNDGGHNWKAQVCFPRSFTQMECEICGETRTPTKKEMKIILS